MSKLRTDCSAIIPAEPGFASLALFFDNKVEDEKGEHFIVEYPWHVSICEDADGRLDKWVTPITPDHEHPASNATSVATRFPSGRILVPGCADYEDERAWVERALERHAQEQLYQEARKAGLV